VGDLNGDGKPDIVTAAGSPAGGDNLSVFLNKGDGTFSAGPTTSIGTVTTTLALADFNRDGKLDLAFGDAYDTFVNVLLGKGDGTFGPPARFATDTSNSTSFITGLAATDLNGDGIPDLAVTNTNAGSLSVLLGKGDGTFAPAVVNSAPSGARLNPAQLAVADINGDGRPDVTVAGLLGVNVLLNDGGGVFTPAAAGGFGSAEFGQIISAYDVVVGDFNGNGKLDLATGNSRLGVANNGNNLSLFLNISGQPGSPGSGQPGSPGIGVFDSGTGTWYLRNQAGAGNPNAGTFQYGAPGWLPVVGDWNGDGQTTVGVIDPTTMTWYLRNEDSAGNPDVVTPFRYGLPGWVPVVGDWGGTGHFGIGAFDPSTGTWYLRNEANAGLPDAGVFPYGAPGWVPVVGDWSGDGKTGIGVVDPATMTWYLRNESSAGNPDAGTFAYGGVGWKPVVGDWNRDGRTTAGVVDPGGIWYLRNSNSAGPPDLTPFPYGLGDWTPLAGTWVAPAQAQLAAGGPAPAGGNSPPLTRQELQATVDAAFVRLQAAGVGSALLNQLAAASYVVAPLGGAYLGLTDVATHTVEISPNAAGYGWFVDPTPQRDEEFRPGAPGSPLVALPGGPVAGKMDLLTVILHEMGHLAGRPDVDGSGSGSDLMADLLTTGVRRTQDLNQVFASGSL
jgi:hypothetical protein